MELIDLKKSSYLDEYIRLCHEEWGKTKKIDDNYIKRKKREILDGSKYIDILGLIDGDKLLGFISLFENDSDERKDLTPWYATMYVKREFRGNGYSKILNKAILDNAKNRGYNKVYLKTDLYNYYEKFGAKNLGSLSDGEKIYYFDLTKRQPL